MCEACRKAERVSAEDLRRLTHRINSDPLFTERYKPTAEQREVIDALEGMTSSQLEVLADLLALKVQKLLEKGGVTFL